MARDAALEGIGHRKAPVLKGVERSGVCRASHMPPSMKGTKISVPVAAIGSAVSAGPGQKPPRPQPVPNSTAPVSSRESRSVRFGRRNSVSKKGRERLRVSQAKPGAVTAMAPPMTKARLGSQVPNRSRKFSTLAGLDMPGTIRPKPKIRPERSAKTCFISASDQVTGDEDGDKGRRHERCGGDDRAHRAAADAADAVTRGAAVAIGRAEAHEQARDRHENRA